MIHTKTRPSLGLISSDIISTVFSKSISSSLTISSTLLASTISLSPDFCCNFVETIKVSLILSWTYFTSSNLVYLMGARKKVQVEKGSSWQNILFKLFFLSNNKNPTYEMLRGKLIKPKIILFKLIFLKNISISLYSNLFPDPLYTYMQ